MEYHVDRRVVLSPQSEHPSLYEWSITEITSEGKVGAEKQIPWEWTLWFDATEVTLSDSLEKEVGLSLFDKDKNAEDAHPIVHRRTIRAKLKPGKRGRASWEDGRYSFFGTDRLVSAFSLRILELDPGEERERCRVYGSPSYTTEGVDFRSETTEDFLEFYLFVKPETFARFATQISLSAVTSVSFGVGHVPGFYSSWSPTVVTDHIKILSSREDQRVEIPAGSTIDLPRLGQIREFHIALSSAHKLQPEADEDERLDDEHLDDFGSSRLASAGASVSMDATSAAFSRHLNQLRIAAWLIVALLVVNLLR